MLILGLVNGMWKVTFKILAKLKRAEHCLWVCVLLLVLVLVLVSSKLKGGKPSFVECSNYIKRW